MGKVKAIGNGYVQIGDGMIVNLNAFETIVKMDIGRGDPNGNICGIKITPITPSPQNVKDGVDGASFLTLYKEGEQKQMETDFAHIVLALQKT
jgi:hypothetical protein